MTGSDELPERDGLDAFFEAARADKPVPSDGLLGRIAADAEDHQPKAAAPVVRQKGRVGRLLDGFGGWPTLGGLATAAVTGLFIGFAQPDLLGVDIVATDDTEFMSVGLWPDDTLFFEEG